MRCSASRLIAFGTVLAVMAAACGSDRDSASSSAAASTTAATTTVVATTQSPSTGSADGGSADSTPASDGSAPATDVAESTEGSGTTATLDTTPADSVAPEGPMFGDAPYPCGAGSGDNLDDGSEVGVTKDSIVLATGDDAGYAGSPGLNHEMADAMKAIVAKCNDLGGINGRKIVLNYYDAAIFNVPVAMQSACDAGTFFLVGEGWSFDSNQEETRLGCNLPAVPGYAVSAAFANGRDMYNVAPNPADQQTGAFYAQMAQLFPEQMKKVAMLAGNYSATQETRDKVVEATPKFGWEFVSTTLEYNITGESDWTPFVKQLQEAGAEVVSWVGSCLPNLQLFAQAAAANGYTPIITADANHYAETCAAANTDGALDNLYMRLVYLPFEEASVNKATQDYIDLMHEKGGDVALLGAESTSAFLLWATAAQSCGPTLTRTCTLDYLRNVHEWTGHGLQAPADPGGNNQLVCAMVLRLEGTKYVRVAPDKPGTYGCDDSWNTPITSTPALAAARLDENRIAQQFAGGG